MNGIGIGIGRKRKSWSRYWNTRTVSGLSAITYSDINIDLGWVNNGVLDYTGHKIYISTDDIDYTLNATIPSIGTTYRVIGLTANTQYYFKIAPYKNINIGNLCNSANDTTVLFADDFAGITINSDKWTESDTSGMISQEEMIVIKNTHAATVSEFTNTLKSKVSIASGIAVAQGHLTWISDGTTISIGGIYLYKDNNNWAAITSRATTAGNKYRLRIYTGGVSRYDLNVASTITKNKYVKIWTDGTNIKFYYWDVITEAWVQMGTTQTFSLGYPLLYTISNVDAATFNGGNPVLIRNAVLSSFEYLKLYSPITRYEEMTLHNIAYCWFNSPKPTYDSVANKTWFNIVHNPNGLGYSQYVATLDHSNKSLSVIKIGSVYQSDDHNEGSILVRTSDGKLFTSYTEHTKVGSPLRHRISTNERDGSVWEAEATTDPDNPNRYTYANAFEVSNGDIYIFYRSTLNEPASNTWRFIKSEDGGETFGASTTYFDFTISPYMRIFQSKTDKDIIHFIGCSHPIIGTAINKLIHFYFDAGVGTWHKSDGTDISADIPFDDSNATVVISKNDPEQIWIEDLILDASGNPRILFTYYSDIDNHPDLKYLYYTEWTGSVWTTPYQIHQSCHKNIASTNPANESTYMPLACFDRGNPNRIFAGKEISIGGVIELFQITRVSANSFTSLRITTLEEYDQWRPTTTDAETYNLIWLNKMDYTSYVNFNQQLMIKTI